ncbi:KH domain-containing protein at4g18375-like protein [Trifolium pratense]|uniref:KH domain-containing protein at4g18375-like protein n=1 Tax=Trifolium pratense TaxID=57577 RepID=A0A2K3NTP6_TRIPR|nr:KH domain-containing protein at4g18375-like protein [Trifolium pratense]
MTKRPKKSDSNRRGKRRKPSGVFSPLDVSASVVFRLLCPATRIGGVIGKGGSIISQIRHETGVKVKIEEPVPGCEERVITFLSSDKESEDGSGELGKEVNNNDEGEGKDDEGKGNGDDNEDKDSVSVEDSQSEKGYSTATILRAVTLVFDRMVEGILDIGEAGDESVKGSYFALRLLILSNQVGCIMGKGGSVIKRMSAESGAQIRILAKEEIPSCASDSDELVQVTGGVEVVRKALQFIFQQLLENTPRDHESLSSNLTGPSSHSYGQFPPTKRTFAGQGASFATGANEIPVYHSAPMIPKFHEGAIHGRMRPSPSPEILTFRLLCPSENVGNLIGKGGSTIMTMQQETASEIKVIEPIPGSEDCIIVISGPAHPDDRISPVQEALFRVQNRISRAIPDAKEHGAHIRMLGKDKGPKCVSEEDEVIQVSGEIEAVHDALLQITARLKYHFYRDVFPSGNFPSNSAFLDQHSPFPPHLGRRGLSPPGMYSDRGPHVGFPLDDHPPFMNNIYRPGIPPHISERKPWGPKGILEGGGHMGLPEFTGGPRRISGFAGGSQPIITNTTVEVVVPRALVPVIYGEDGECLKQILQISDANVIITDPKPGAVETKIIISGTPEQTNAAQSLIQAFVMSEREFC